MESIRNMESLGICPYLKGGSSGAQCGVVKMLVKDMHEVNIRICMSRRHEACAVYMCSLQNVQDGSTYKPSPCSGI